MDAEDKIQTKTRVILASASPRRKELLQYIFDEFEVIPSDFDESAIYECSPVDYVKLLSYFKAKSVAETEGGGDNTIIVAADTVVIYKNVIYGKPKDKTEAVKTLSTLGGKIHRVYTGVTVLKGNQKLTFAACSFVRIKSLTDVEINAYVDNYRPFDKAGAYAVQDGVLVKSYLGSYTNIVGLPIEKLRKQLRKMELI